MGKETNKEIIDIKLSRIIKDKKQLSIRIPSDMVLEFLVDTTKDGFIWTIEKEKDKEELFLRGTLIKGIKFKR